MKWLTRWSPVVGALVLATVCGALAGAAWRAGPPRPGALAGGMVMVACAALAALAIVLGAGWWRSGDRVRRLTAELETARAELATEEGFLDDVLTAIDISIVLSDAQGRPVHSNHAAEALGAAGWAPGLPENPETPVRILGPDGRDPLPVEDRPTRRALTGESVRDRELVVEPVEGPRRTLMVNARPLRDDSASIIGAVTSSYDITALREYQSELASFAGTVAHDLKSPLSAVIGYAERLTDTIDEHLVGLPRLEAQHAATRLVAAANRMHQLINDLLAYTKARDAALTVIPVDLRALIDEVVTTYTDDWQTGAADVGRRKPVIFVGPLPAVEADRALLRQVIDNLIGNAMKYTEPGQLPRISITAQAKQDGWIQVQFADRGIGIPSGQHARVFDHFHRAHTAPRYAGTGLGLAICRRVIQRHGGKITASDNPGGGTVFRFTLPVATSEPAAGGPAKAAPPTPTAAPHYVWLGRRLDTTEEELVEEGPATTHQK